MRIVWKDSLQPEEYKKMKYRGFFLWGTPSGWETDVPGDNNLYKNNYSAMNSIDAYFGESGKGSAKRQSYGIQIIGEIKKAGEA